MSHEVSFRPGVLAAHCAAAFAIGPIVVTMTLVPLIALQYFHASAWGSLAITAAGPTLLTASILWNAWLSRVGPMRYLPLHWLTAAAPIGAMALAPSYGWLLAAQIVSATGLSGWTPVDGLLLKRLYPDAIRGRIFGALTATRLISQAVTVLTFGWWLQEDADAFRIFLPLVALSYAVGLLIVAALLRRCTPPTTEAPRPAPRPWQARDVLRPIAQMGHVLRNDPRFLRFERAFMTYGCGFMICDALLPLIATHRLGLNYQEVSWGAHMVMRLVMILMILPIGWLQDHVGPMRVSTASFGVLAAYPLLLLAAADAWGLSLSSAVGGVGLTGVLFGWMLGPVQLAPSPDRVSEYVAIHTTLVGLRGILFQFMGIALYQLTSSSTLPLIVAALAFAYAAWQMARLERVTVAAAQATPQGPPPGRPAGSES